MDRFEDDEELLVQYTGDEELFGIFRINALQKFVPALSKKGLIGWNKLLLNITRDYNLTDTDTKLLYESAYSTGDVTGIIDAIPEKWIRECFDYLDSHSKDAQIINLYASDVMWLALINYNTHKVWVELFDQVNDVILRCPPTDRKFTVFRGINTDTFNSISDRIVFDTPKSASFGTIHCEKHIGAAGCVFIINVPCNKHLAYHESEDQVIFPIGTELEVTDIIPARIFSIGTFKAYILNIID